MVIKRSCSFCAGEIEPGTGSMFVKRDGTVFHFCSSSCRKQQMGLGRVGHRIKWTRAHALKKAAEQTASKSAAAPPAARTPAPVAPKPAEPAPATPAPAPAAATSPAPAKPAKAPKAGAKKPA